MKAYEELLPHFVKESDLFYEDYFVYSNNSVYRFIAQQHKTKTDFFLSFPEQIYFRIICFNGSVATDASFFAPCQSTAWRPLTSGSISFRYFQKLIFCIVEIIQFENI